MKALIFVLSLAVIIALPAFLIQQVVIFVNDDNIKTANVFQTKTQMVYPNITLCHPKYFDNGKLRAHNISNELANYMTLVMDPSLPSLIEFMLSNLTGTAEIYSRIIATYEPQLDAILELHQMTLLELYKAVAIECELIVIYCELHRESFTSNRFPGGKDETSCCTLFFNEDPIFSLAGTCYTTNVAIAETNAASFSSFTLMADLTDQLTPALEVLFKGLDAVLRDGLVWSVGNSREAAGPATYAEPKLAIPGSVNMIALNMEVIDRSRLNQPCLQGNNMTFKAMFGFYDTNMNCAGLALHQAFNNCSLAPYMGYNQREYG